MKKKTIVTPTEEDLLVDLTFRNISAKILAEFATKIVRPYYSGNMNKALKDLILNSIRDEDFVLSHLKIVECGDNG